MAHRIERMPSTHRGAGGCRSVFYVLPVFGIVAAWVIGGAALAQAPVGSVLNIPQPDNNAFSTSLRYDSSGDLYAWDGLNVWEQNGGTGSFNNIGSVTTGNSADAGPISFSQNGQSLLLSNGAGGFLGGSYNGIFWTMPAAGGAATQVSGSGVPYMGDALALPAASTIPGSGTMYLVYAGNASFTGSSLSILDASTGTNRVIIDNGPGATASIAINPKNESLYVGVGYGPAAGDIYSFSLSQVDNAYSSGTPINFTSGTLFNPAGTGSQSGADMFFDNNGYLFSGGDGTTVFQPNGTVAYDQSAGAGENYYVTLSFDPAKNEVLAVPYGSSTGTLYNATEFEAASGTSWQNPHGGSWGSGSNWVGGTVPSDGLLIFAGSTSGTAVVTLDGIRTVSALQFGGSSATGSFTITAGSGGELTLGDSTGGSIMVESGTNSISAPIVLADSLAVSISAGGILQLGGISQNADIAAALSLSGEGALILSGTDNYTGGTSVSGGTMYASNAAALADGSELIVGGDTELLFGRLGITAGQAAPRAAPDGVITVPEPASSWLCLVAGVCFLGVWGRLPICRAVGWDQSTGPRNSGLVEEKLVLVELSDLVPLSDGCHSSRSDAMMVAVGFNPRFAKRNGNFVA
jgi:autotransporter-associated beta strand protein